MRSKGKERKEKKRNDKKKKRERGSKQLPSYVPSRVLFSARTGTSRHDI
jgi:hypothetical protein